MKIGKSCVLKILFREYEFGKLFRDLVCTEILIPLRYRY